MPKCTAYKPKNTKLHLKTTKPSGFIAKLLGFLYLLSLQHQIPNHVIEDRHSQREQQAPRMPIADFCKKVWLFHFSFDDQIDR